MVKVKIIRKRTSGSTSMARTSGGLYRPGGSYSSSTDYAKKADHAKSADTAAEATHAAAADNANEATHAASAADLDSGSTVWTTIKQWIAELKEQCLKWFLRKDTDDTAAGRITFAKGWQSSEDVTADKNAAVGGNASVTGNATVGGTVDTDTIQSSTRNDGIEDIQGGKGFKLWMDGGVSRLIIDKLSVRLKAYFSELEIRRLSYSAGNLNLSGAGAKLDYVLTDGSVSKDGKATPATYARCYFLANDGDNQTVNLFHAGDMVMCKTFNIAKAGSYKDVATRYYWRTCIAVSTAITELDGKKYHYIDLAMSEKCTIGGKQYPGYDTVMIESGKLNDAPQAGDEVAVVGNLIDEDRQNVVQLVAVGDYAPSINLYDKIGSGGVYCLLSDHWPVRISPKGVFINADYLRLTVSDNGKTTEKAISDYVDGMVKSGVQTVTARVTTVEADVKGIRTTVQQHTTDINGLTKQQAELKATAESISLRVSSQRTGRNLWINGDFEMDADKAPKYSYNLGDEGGNIGTNEVDLPAGFNKRLAFKCSKAFQGIYYNGTQPHLSMKKGTTYCLSFFAKATSNTDVVTGQIYFGLSGLKTVTEDITGTWKRYAIYITPDKDYVAKDITPVFYPYTALADSNGNVGYICITGIQFEVGSESSGAPTVWCKGYETEDAVTELKQTVDGISSTVSKQTTDINGLTERQTKIEQTSTEISSTVTEQGEKIARQETEIRQTANDIKASVRNEEKEAGLEITPDGVTLNGDKTTITGDLKLGGSFWGVLRRKAITITKDNYTEYISVSSDGVGGSIATMKLEAAGSYVIFDKDLPILADKIQIILPTIPRTADGETFTADDEYPTFENWAQYARTFVGTRIMAYNYSQNTVVFYGMPLSMDKINTNDTINGIPVFRYDSANSAFCLYTNNFAAFECAATFGYGNTERAASTPEERIVWNATGGLMADENSKYVQAM